MIVAVGEWVDDALCAQVDPEVWFPDRGQPNRDAKQICRSCAVRAECLEYALSRDEDEPGVWGGLSERERRRMRRERSTAT